jgi:hypothetical protein
MVPICEIQQLTFLQAAKCLQSYLKSNQAVQSHVRYLLPIVNDPHANGEEREQTMKTLYDLLFPGLLNPWESNGEVEEGL